MRQIRVDRLMQLREDNGLLFHNRIREELPTTWKVARPVNARALSGAIRRCSRKLPRTTFDRRLLSIRRSRFPRFFVVQLQNFLRAD